MIYDKQTALVKAGDLIPHRDYDGQVEDVAAALLEAQAGAMNTCAARADDSWMQDEVFRLIAVAAELRGER